ncbi:hypothetical protein [uncultured Ruegeria sp.]|uniref:hypothetical protein n=1 Tax=uncultured Ruegeria sp. TaxID=259304 RepID=UPI0026093919|nr:hypothetical protein [uncultured Ruegeria sp.]
MGKKSERREGVAIQRIVDRLTGKTVGWVYRWNTDEITHLWLARKTKDVDFLPLKKKPTDKIGQ